MIRSLFRRRQKLTQWPQPFTVGELFKQVDVFYVCFDEPNRKENWTQIKSVLPRAKKIEGVLGFDSALKKCAKRSKTEYFFLIDGDNRLLPERFERTVRVENLRDDYVLSWSSFNPTNGLAYGNGGLKLWPKDVAVQLRSHESAGAGDDPTDYCFVADYYLVDDYVTETIVNTTAKQSFRAGFREGVKMSLAWGKQVDLDKENFHHLLGVQNRMRLKVWCEVGADSANGRWGILGARMGLIQNAIDKFDYKNINSYQWIDSLFEGEVLPSLGLQAGAIENLMWDQRPLKKRLFELGQKINDSLPLDLQELSPVESLNFKKKFINPSRSGLLGRAPRP